MQGEEVRIAWHTGDARIDGALKRLPVATVQVGRLRHDVRRLGAIAAQAVREDVAGVVVVDAVVAAELPSVGLGGRIGLATLVKVGFCDVAAGLCDDWSASVGRVGVRAGAAAACLEGVRAGVGQRTRRNFDRWRGVRALTDSNARLAGCADCQQRVAT